MLWFAAAGSALGGMSRLLRGTYLRQKTGSTFPVGTLLINISGPFLLGLLLRYSLATQAISPDVRARLTTGFCRG
jgi:CrcB protein